MIRAESIQIPFAYAAGDVGSRFLAALRDEAQILASRCPACARTVCPARSLCPVCGASAEPELVEVGPCGELLAVAGDEAGRFGLVRLDGADTAMIHRLLPPGGGGGWASGRRVRARFGAERAGSILDIEGFEPAGGDR